MAEEFDVVVVGAGPAGSLTAQYAALAGLSVAIIERRTRVGEPVQCGEFVPGPEETKLMFTKYDSLDDMFDIPESIKSLNTDEILVHSPKEKIFRIPFLGFSVERKNFDKFLAERAVKSGAKLFTKTHARALEGDIVKTTKGDFKGKVIVGADGPHSKIGSCVGLKGPTTLCPCILADFPGEFEAKLHVYLGRWGPGGYAWIIPKKNSANIGLGIQKNYTDISLRQLFEKFIKHLKLDKTEPNFRSGGIVPMGGIVSKTVKNNVMLVGDAAGMVMASNGGGIVPAMLAGRLAGKVAGEHVNNGTPLENYEKQWRAVLGKPLKTALRTKKIADKVFGSDSKFEFSLSMVGKRGVERGIKCKPVFGI